MTQTETPRYYVSARPVYDGPPESDASHIVRWRHEVERARDKWSAARRAQDGIRMYATYAEAERKATYLNRERAATR